MRRIRIMFASCGHHKGMGLVAAATLLPLILAQPGFGLKMWQRAYGGLQDDEAFSVQQTTDGGYIVAGLTLSFAPWPGNVYLVKTDSNGDTLWTSTWGGSGDDMAHSVWQNFDGGYIVAGYTGPSGSPDHDFYLIRTDASGDTIWSRTFGGSGDQQAYSVQQTLDSGFIVSGYTTSYGATEGAAYLVKTDASGDTQWTRMYGAALGADGEAIEQTADSGYIVTGYLSGNVYLVKTDASGDSVWSRTYGASGNARGFSVQQTLDGGYIVAGATSGNVYLVKTNASGDTQWTRTYGGNEDDEGMSVRQTRDSGYIVAGYTRSFGAGDYDVYLIRTDANGETLWTRTFGDTAYDAGYSVQQTSDGGYVVAGITNSYGPGTPSRDNMYLIKTGDDGSTGIEEPLRRHPTVQARLLAQPNPFASSALVPGHETDVFVLSDITGRRVALCRGDRVGAGLRPGVYFLSPVKAAGHSPVRHVRIVKAE